MGFTDTKKKESVYLVQHYMRMAVLGKPGWLELPAAPHVNYGAPLNPFYNMGSRFAEFNCRNAAAMLKTWPQEPAEEIPVSDMQMGVAEAMSQQINHPWQTLGMLYDQPLLMRENTGAPHQLHYWVLHGFVQDAVHLPFLYTQRISQQVHYYESLRGTAMHPGPIGHFAEAPVHPLLDGRRLHFGAHSGSDIEKAFEGDSLSAKVGNSLRCNFMRTFLLMQQPLWAAGQKGNYIYTDENNIGTIMEHYAKCV